VSREIRIPLPDGGRSVGPYRPEMSSAIGALYRAATAGTDLDPVVLEVVRIRCARVHDCRRCKAARFGGAHDAGVDEAMLDEVDLYERSTLPARLKVALRYTDAFVTRPGEISPELRRDLHAHFSPSEIVSISLLIVSFSLHKPSITLGTDGDPGGNETIAWFDFDAAGDVVFLGTDASPEKARSAG
jgi:hypothetical protein